MPVWTSPDCDRAFNRANEKHSRGTGDRAAMLACKPAPLVALYEALERTALGYGGVEVVSRGRYAPLFRTSRIFADVVFMEDALRVALQLDRDSDDACGAAVAPAFRHHGAQGMPYFRSSRCRPAE